MEMYEGDRIPAYEGKEPYVFISYRHMNSPRVMPDVEALYKKKYRAWYDEGIAPGSEWPANIANHLEAAKAVVFFISDSFIGAINCENEVENALRFEKQRKEKGREYSLIQYSIDGTRHPKLEGYPLVTSTEELLALLPDSFIGDGRTGYSSELGKVRRGNIWNILIGLVIALSAAMGLAVFGLQNGYFDRYFPGIRSNVSYEDLAYDEEADMGEVTDAELPDISNDSVSDEFWNQIGVKNPAGELEFQNENSEWILRDALGIHDERPLNNLDVSYNKDVTELRFYDMNDEVIAIIADFPYLRRLYIYGGSFSTLEPLARHINLRRVYLPRYLLEQNEITIPSERTFKVYLDD
ncbi:MAG: toll/interleukin-1 receptor domain-containing protein [Clostridia bacterium]|nr:toll/interleukin-1 receptor domain-containing protein [Clostridia bacterium]